MKRFSFFFCHSLMLTQSWRNIMLHLDSTFYFHFKKNLKTKGIFQFSLGKVGFRNLFNWARFDAALNGRLKDLMH
jgi:hypothetical protein